tara:strand:- start:204 stop:635 length:432 start_codon:yes stop_codon:yes gene_type:complete
MLELSVVEKSIKHSIEKNGFPEKSVRLPFKSIHESCKSHNIALKNVLANLIQHNIVGTIQGDFIEFRTSDNLARNTKSSNKTNDPSETTPPNMEDLKNMAQSYMSKMTPEQIKELEKTVSNMSEEERKNIIKNFSNQFFKNKS